MTPSTSPTFGGFIQGLQAEVMSLIGAIIFILIVRWIASVVISKMAEGSPKTDDAQSARKLANWVAGILILLTIAVFSIRAATFATNQIPHSDLDKSTIYEDMNANIIKKQ